MKKAGLWMAAGILAAMLGGKAMAVSGTGGVLDGWLRLGPPAVGTGGHDAMQARDTGTAEAHETGTLQPRGSDVSRLLDAVEPMLQGAPSVTVKRGAALAGYTGTAELQAAARELSSRFGMKPEDDCAEASGVPLCRASASLPMGDASLLLAGSPDGGTSRLVVSLQAAAGADADVIEEWQRQTDRVFAAIGAGGSWNAAVQGIAKREATAGADGPERVAQSIAAGFGAKEQERYADVGTVSVSFSGGGFASSIVSGKHRLSVQVALHRLTKTELWRLTVATPVITSEY